MKKIILTLIFVSLLALIGVIAHAASTTSTYLPLVMMAPPTPTPTLTPTPVPTPLLLPNGDFEQGRTIWHEYSSLGFSIIHYKDELKVPPYDGSWAAWEGGSNNLAESIDQTVLVSADRPFLSFWIWINSTDSCNNDLAKVTVKSTVIEQFWLCTSSNTNKWVQKVYDLHSYVGQNVTIMVSITTNGSLPSSLYLDHFAFQWNP